MSRRKENSAPIRCATPYLVQRSNYLTPSERQSLVREMSEAEDWMQKELDRQKKAASSSGRAS